MVLRSVPPAKLLVCSVFVLLWFVMLSTKSAFILRRDVGASYLSRVSFQLSHQQQHWRGDKSIFAFVGKKALHSKADGGMEELSEKTRKSVSGIIYGMDGPKITLFTKDECTLCDKVKEVLYSIRNNHPHSLVAVDITDPENTNWFAKYKYDIPILHMDDVYWTKHCLSVEDAEIDLEHAANGTFDGPKTGEPNAEEMERKTQDRSSR